MSVTLTLREAADELGVSTQTIRRWISAGKLPAELQSSRYGPQYAIEWEHVDAARDLVRVLNRRDVHQELIDSVASMQTQLEEIRRAIHEQVIQSQQFQLKLQSMAAELQATRQELGQLRQQLMPEPSS